MNKNYRKLSIATLLLTLLSATPATALAQKAATAAPQKIEAQPTYADSLIVYGLNKQTGDWQTTSKLPRGYYSFHVAPTISFSNESASATLPSGNVSFIANGKAYFIVTETQWSDETYSYTYSSHLETYDMATWTKSGSDVQLGSINPYAAAFNPADGKVYYLYTTDDYATGIGTINLTNGTTTALATTTDGYPATITAGPDGCLYSLDSGNLFKFDPTTNEFSIVGNFGYYSTGNGDGTVIDPATGKLYWVGYSGYSETHLYAIDTKTASLTDVATMPSQEQFTTLYIPSTNAGAPAAATGIKYEDGKIKFTAPTTTYDGQSLSGTLDAITTIDGEETTTQVTAGANAEVAATLAAGSHTIGVQTANAAGRSPLRKFNVFIGDDAPAKADSVTVDYDKAANTADITWKAPKASIHGGAIDDNALRYTVVRQPDATTVVEKTSDLHATDQLPETRGKYFYQVIAYNGDIAGDTATSAAFTGGGAIVPPFTETFDTQDDFNSYTVVNSDGDYYTWTWDFYNKMACFQSTSGMDDWLISPAIKLQTGREYKLTTNARDEGSQANGLEIYLLKSADINSDRQEIDRLSLTPNDKDYTSTISVPSDGNYFLAYHAVETGSCGIYLNGYTITADASNSAPGSVTDATATAAPEGALQATLTFKAPTTTIDGQTLSSLDSINITRSDEQKPFATIKPAVPGNEYTVVDTAAKQGFNNYLIRAYDANGEGKELQLQAYVGIDYSKAVNDFKATTIDNNSVKLTWTKPDEIGQNGGFAQVDSLSYEIYRYDIQTGQWTQIGETKGFEYTDSNIQIAYNARQEYMQYGIYPVNKLGTGKGAAANIFVGEPYTTPFAESTKGGSFKTDAWTLIPVEGTIDGYTSGWLSVASGSTGVKPIDNDGGMQQFVNPGQTPAAAMLLSPKIKVESNDYLTFYMYHDINADDNSYLAVLLQRNDADTTRIATIPLGGSDGWQRHSIFVGSNSNSKSVNIGFLGRTTDNELTIYLDNMNVGALSATDLSLSSTTNSIKVGKGDTITLKYNVENIGANNVDGFSLKIHADGLVDSTYQSDEKLAANEVKEVEFNIPVTIGNVGNDYDVIATLSADGDDNALNDTVSTSVTVSGNDYPTVTDLTGNSIDGTTVNLSWTKPSALYRLPETDSFEDYDEWATDNLGSWTMYDGDGLETLNIGLFTNNPQKFSEKAFQVLNPSAENVDLTQFPTVAPHSGNQYLGAFSSAEYDYMTGDMAPSYNDNWLIHSVNGGTTLSFWASEADGERGPETFEVLYSTTDNSTASFQLLASGSISEAKWQQFSYELPADAKYFAIRHTTMSNGQLFMLDDISFASSDSEPVELNLTGYNVYRDGKLIAENVQEPAYTDKPSAGSHTYYVTAVWELGESNASNPYTIETVVDAINSVSTEPNANTEIYTLNGTKVKTLQRGVNIIRANGKVYKVIKK